MGNRKGKTEISGKIVLRAALAAVCVVALGSSNVTAAPLVWTLTGVTFDDGGTAAGSFQFDSTGPFSGIYSDLNITTTLGGSLAGATYTTLFGGCANRPTALCLVPVSEPDLTGSPILEINFTPSLTDAGGSISLSGNEGVCLNPSCGSTTPDRFISGTVTASTAPEPSSLSLTLIFLGALGLFAATRARLKLATSKAGEEFVSRISVRSGAVA